MALDMDDTIFGHFDFDGDLKRLPICRADRTGNLIQFKVFSTSDTPPFEKMPVIDVSNYDCQDFEDNTFYFHPRPSVDFEEEETGETIEEGYYFCKNWRELIEEKGEVEEENENCDEYGEPVPDTVLGPNGGKYCNETCLNRAVNN